MGSTILLVGSITAVHLCYIALVINCNPLKGLTTHADNQDDREGVQHGKAIGASNLLQLQNSTP